LDPRRELALAEAVDALDPRRELALAEAVDALDPRRELAFGADTVVAVDALDPRRLLEEVGADSQFPPLVRVGGFVTGVFLPNPTACLNAANISTFLAEFNHGQSLLPSIG